MGLVAASTNGAISPGMISYVYGSGGSAPYVYSVVPGGAGGTVASDTGLYTAPLTIGETPAQFYDTIRVTDAGGATADTRILVGDSLILLCDIIQREMDLADGRVYIWDQKINQPKDASPYVAVAVVTCKPFSNVNKLNADGESEQFTNFQAQIQIDIISRGPSARTRKEEIILALNSNYAQSQQEKNSFTIGKLPPGARFINLSQGDGAAIPYRFSIGVSLLYAVTKTKVVPYIDSFSDPQIITDPKVEE